MKPTRLTITVRDGIGLAADIYMPTNGVGKFPTLLEALPYRKDDLTASSHSEEYLRLASEGNFVVCRLDLRGTGSSQGVATDEYPLSELDDLADVINWLATQPWSNGRVGMFGYSYSGFNSLQAACTRPKALKAICAIYATDDRYTDDGHYMGGSLRAIDLVDYCHYMTACNLLPPVPAVFGDDWLEEWKMRFEKNQPWLLNWLEQQHDGPYWRHGSLRPDYERIECPTMIVAGWADGYRNNTFRTFEALKCEKSLLLGPWSHSSPSTSRPGPHIDLVAEMIVWFNRWLRNSDAANKKTVPSEPPIRIFIRHSTRPSPDLAMFNGEWRYEDSWPPKRLQTKVLTISGSGVDVIATKSDVGAAAWNSCAGGLPWGQPDDQREDDAWSLTYEWPVDKNSIEVIGHALAKLRLAVDQPVASLSVKLCDVFPDGTSALVTRGFLNLCHRKSSTNPTALTPGKFEDITIEFEATSWVFPVGHKIRLSITGADWPNIWSPPQQFSLQVERQSLELNLSVVEGQGAGTPMFAPVIKPDKTQALEPTTDTSLPTEWRVERDILRRITTARTSYGGHSSIRDAGTADELYAGEVGVSTVDPANSWVTATTRYELAWPEATCLVEARLQMNSDTETFQVTIEVDAKLDGVEFAKRQWKRVIPRRLL
ncbi:MAG: CocE/NonD family hydrolase [Actinobacteria bacterium]|nr:CocE/NonD family hydrolase [Actinomycetota bacterium]